MVSSASAELFDPDDGRVLKLFRDSVSDEMIAREAVPSAHAASCRSPPRSVTMIAKGAGTSPILG
jgi:hypothetical protein